MPRLSLDVEDGADGRRTLAVEGEIDLSNADELAAAAREALAAGPVLLDLRKVAFMDSSGIRVLSVLVRDAPELRLCDELQPAVVQVLELTGMMSVLPLERCA